MIILTVLLEAFSCAPDPVFHLSGCLWVRLQLEKVFCYYSFEMKTLVCQHETHVIFLQDL